MTKYISGRVVVHSIVTEVDRSYAPIVKLGREVPSGLVTVTEIPVFIVKAYSPKSTGSGENPKSLPALYCH